MGTGGLGDVGTRMLAVAEEDVNLDVEYAVGG